jgi:hypothetical protein
LIDFNHKQNLNFAQSHIHMYVYDDCVAPLCK